MSLALAPSPLLSVEASSRDARALRCWGEADQACLTEVAKTTLDQWMAAWGITRDETMALRCQPASAMVRESLTWTPLDRSGKGVWWAVQDKAASPRPLRTMLDALYLALFHEAPAEPGRTPRLADGLVQAAWADWQRRAGDLFAGSTTPNAVEAQLQPWSGAVAISLPWCGQDTFLLLTMERVAAFLKRPEKRMAMMNAHTKMQTPLISLFEVVKSKPVSLRAELSEMQIDLGTLAGLRPGDVLHTSHRLDTPLLLKGENEPGGMPSCTGYLGRQGDRRAIELLAHAEPLHGRTED